MDKFPFNSILSKSRKAFTLSLPILFVLFNINLLAQNSPYYIPESYPIPLDSISQITNLVPLVSDSIDTSKLIIVYGFTGCKPCEVLQRRIQRKIDKEVITPSQIIYVNIFILDTITFKEKLQKNNITFQYYATESPYAGEINGAFPIIAAYTDGIKEWVLNGYSPSNKRTMFKYIE
jgi:thioredoxin-related protein